MSHTPRWHAEVDYRTDAGINTVAVIDGLPKAPNAPSKLDVILAWYKTLPAPARRKLSLANLHDLSKRIP